MTLKEHIIVLSKEHIIVLSIGLGVWLAFFIVGIPSNYFTTWTFAEQVLLSLITFFGIFPVVGTLLLIFIGHDYFRTAIWLAFYWSVPLFIPDAITVGILKGEGLHFLTSHWYASIAYLYVWIELPIIALAIRKCLRE